MKTYEIKTSKDGQQDLHTINGDFFCCDNDKFVICKRDGDGEPYEIAAFQFWVYGLELPLEEENA